MGETANKKDKEKKKAKSKQDKAQKMRDRKENNDKGKSLEDMMAYLDENGNLSSTPPNMERRKEINLEDIQLGAAKPQVIDASEITRTGVVTFFNEAKGYGFINDLKSQQSVFVHINQLSAPLREHDKVTFETEAGPRGLSAIKVKKTA
ncbi:MAG: cold shock protein [Flavipsychrobacter sp.]|nr:cold shock protein [Flavipsychrobacter sp.]